MRGVHDFDGWPSEIGDSWPCQGLTSELDLDPLLARVERHEHLREDELEVAVDHPHHLGERKRVLLARDREPTSGKIVHEVVVRLVGPEFWPELTLAVRDAHTRAHLENVELRIRSGPSASLWGRNQPGTLLGDGLTSPIALMGGRDANASTDTVAGMALRPAPGEPPRLVELARRSPPERGVIVSARAPGYAWGSTSLDVSKGDRELLLEPATTLDVWLTNVQIERYAELDVVPMLCVYWIRQDGGNSYVRFERLDEALATEGLRLDSLVPGGYRVAVELGGGSWTEQPVLALEEVSVAAGEMRELVLPLADPPAPPERATLGGTVSLPTFAGEDTVRLRLYHESSGHRAPHAELALADMEPVTGRLPTWSFHAEDLPVGLYQLTLLPFLTSWMVELPAGGRGDVTLVVPELAEVLVETVDAHTGERIPFDQIYYRNMDVLPDLHQNNWTRAEPESPGRYRFWMAPGSAHMWSREVPSGLDYGERSMDLELVAGFQSVRFEFEPVYAFRIELREGGVVVPGFDPIWGELLRPQNLRAVDHDGLPTSLGRFAEKRLVEVSAPGLYEVSFEGVGADRFHPIPPRLVDVRAGETAEVIVELHRK